MLSDTRYKVYYPTSDTTGIEKIPTEVVLTQELDKHDVLTIRHQGTFSFIQDAVRTGALVRTLCQSPYGQVSWFGYVDMVTPVDDGALSFDPAAYTGGQGGSEVTTEVVCAGITFPMKQTDTTSEENVSISESVERRVLRAGLIPFVSHTPLKQTVVQSGQTDWALMTRLGHIAGRLSFSTGSTVNWLTIRDIFAHYTVSAPRLTHISKSTTFGDVWAMRYYEEEYGSDSTGVEDQETATTLSGVDPVSGTVVTNEVGSGNFTRYVDEVVQSGQDLAEKAYGSWARTFSRFATVRGPGNPYVRPGTPVFFRGPYDAAWWLVRKVEHTWHPRSHAHLMEVSLARRDDFPDHVPTKYPQVSISRRSGFGNLQQEYRPLLSAGSTYTTGAVDAPRWVADRRGQ